MNMYPHNMIEPFWFFHATKQNLVWIHHHINEKARFAEYAENNWLGDCLVEQSGMDCDGVRYRGQIMQCPPDFYAFQKMCEHEYEYADGPMYFRLITDEEADQMQYESRDLAMEAFENGHPHILYESEV